MTRPWKRRVEIGPHVMLLGDCLEILPSLGPVDACLCDPPYGIGEDGGKFRGRKGQGHRVLEKKSWDKERLNPAFFSWLVGNNIPSIVWGGQLFRGFTAAVKGLALLG